MITDALINLNYEIPIDGGKKENLVRHQIVVWDFNKIALDWCYLGTSM